MVMDDVVVFRVLQRERCVQGRIDALRVKIARPAQAPRAAGTEVSRRFGVPRRPECDVVTLADELLDEQVHNRFGATVCGRWHSLPQGCDLEDLHPYLLRHPLDNGRAHAGISCVRPGSGLGPGRRPDLSF